MSQGMSLMRILEAKLEIFDISIHYPRTQKKATTTSNENSKVPVCPLSFHLIYDFFYQTYYEQAQ